MQAIKNSKPTSLTSLYQFGYPADANYSDYWQSVISSARASGAKLVTGPVMGDTWHRYRTVIADSGRPAFMLEPFNTDWQDYLKSGLDMGFAVTETYASSICDLRRDAPVPDYPGFEGLTFKTFDLDNFDLQLSQIYQLSCQSFVQNHLYRPISMSQFATLYQPLKPLLAKSADLTVLVFDQDELVGVCLVLPDCLDSNGKTAVLKTLMRKSGPAYSKLGLALVDGARNICRDRGFDNLILALYKEDGFSSYIPGLVGAELIRRYGLLTRSLITGQGQ